MLPAALVYSIIHETGPFVTAGCLRRVGAGIALNWVHEGNEQIDAIEASGVIPEQ